MPTETRMPPNEADERIARAFEALPMLAANAPDLVRRGRFLSCDFCIGAGAIPLHVRILDGGIAGIARGPFVLKPWAFAVRADAEAWSRYHEPFPPPGFHDLLALTKSGRAVIEGNLVPFMANLQYVKDLLALPRRLDRNGGLR